jgi:hypothetical protein
MIMNDWIEINDWLRIGCLTACGQCPADICVHIWRDDFPDKCSQRGYPRDIVIEYKDGDALSPEIKDTMITLARSIRIRNREITSAAVVLVHCHAGQTRSPSIGAYLLSLVEGMDIFDSVAIVSRALWIQRRLPMNTGHKFLESASH